jgi:hypothetical protein
MWWVLQRVLSVTEHGWYHPYGLVNCQNLVTRLQCATVSVAAAQQLPTATCDASAQAGCGRLLQHVTHSLELKATQALACRWAVTFVPVYTAVNNPKGLPVVRGIQRFGKQRSCHPVSSNRKAKLFQALICLTNTCSAFDVSFLPCSRNCLPLPCICPAISALAFFFVGVCSSSYECIIVAYF